MSNLMKHRWFELRHQPFFLLTLVLCYVLAFLVIGTTGNAYRTDPSMVAGAAPDWLGLFMNASADLLFPLMIIGGTFTAGMLCQQFSNRTVDLEIAAGHSRNEIFASQSIVGFVIINFAILPPLLLGCLLWIGRVPLPAAAVVFPYLLRAFCLLFLLNCTFFSACLLFVVLFRDPAKTMAVSAIFLLLVFWLMPALEAPLAKAPGTLYPLTPTLPLYLHPAFLMRYVLYVPLTPAQGIWSAGVAVGWSAIFLGAAYCIFRRCELK